MSDEPAHYVRMVDGVYANCSKADPGALRVACPVEPPKPVQPAMRIEAAPPQAIYPKTYATVVGLFPNPGEGAKPPWPEWVVIRIDGDPDGKQQAVPMSWKNGGRSSTLVRVGRRIKLYRRPQDDHPSFRMVGD